MNQEAVLSFSNNLCDTHLQSSSVTKYSNIYEGTSLLSRHLRSHIRRFSKLSHSETPVGRQQSISATADRQP